MVTEDLPQTIDEPPYFLMWRSDELALPVGGLGIGIMLDYPLALFLIGLVMIFFYRRLCEGHAAYYAFHWLYWLGLFPMRSRLLGNPYVRRYFP